MVITSNKKRGLLLQRLLWMGAILSMGCQNWFTGTGNGVAVSSFIILPSLQTRRNFARFKGASSRSSLLGTMDDNDQPPPRNDDALAVEDKILGNSRSKPIPNYEKNNQPSSRDGLNLEKFHTDLEEFSDQQQQHSRDTNNSDPLDVPKPSTLAYFNSSKIIPWKFRDQHYIHSEVTYPTLEWTQQDGFSLAKKPKKLPVVVLVHGFGCSSFYWRYTIRALNKAGYTVYTTDLLGHGQSAKPHNGVVYSTQLWAEQLEEFCNAHISPQQDIVLIGNSVGSLVALLAGGQGSYIRERLLGIGMFNCGIGMNIHGITRDLKWDPLERWFFQVIFAILESKLVFGNTSLLGWILEQLDEKVLTQTLLQLYGEDSSHKVDEELVRSFLNPFRNDIDAASKVLSQILTNDGGPTPREVHGNDLLLTRYLPIHVVWGDSDTVTPLDGIGGVAQFYRELADIGNDNGGPNANKVTMEVIEGAGHILFDEAPEQANGAMVKWLNKL